MVAVKNLSIREIYCGRMNKLEQQITIEESVGLVERGGGPLGIYWQNNFGNGDR